MGTQYHISWVSRFSRQPELEQEKISIQGGVDELLIAFNKSMSTYDPSSELSLINSQFTSDWQVISADLYRVLLMSLQLGEQTAGAFDVTVGPLVNLWGFGPDKRLDQKPSQQAIAQRLSQVGDEVLHLRTVAATPSANPLTLDQRSDVGGFQLKLDAPRYIDLSAIAKGYAVDLLGQYMQQRGIDNFLVEVGGEIIAQGQKAHNKPWRIAIEAPTDDGRHAQKVIPLSGVGIATSGDYRNFFEQDGQRFSHTIDGRTGYPVTHGLASVSVLHESVAMADAWATALTVLGAEEGLKVAERFGLMAFFIQRVDNGFKQYESSQFQQLLLN